MLDSFYALSFPMQKNKLVNKCAFAWNHLVRFLMQKTYPAYCRRHPLSRGICDTVYEAPLIVSFTSFPERIPTIGATVESILRQSLKPNKVLLWLAKEQFPEEKVPCELKKYLDAGLEVRFCDEDLKPHKKSYYTAEAYPDSIIVTIDDEILYGESFLRRLYEAYQNSDKHTVICELGHEIRIGDDNKPKKYNEWNWEAIGLEGPSDLLMPKGAGGVLYPPGFFRDEYFDIEAIRENCLMADDLWLKFMELLHGYKVKKTRAYAKNVYSSKQETQKYALANSNNGENRNNVFLSNLVKKFDQIHWEELK